jgi:hypothetical protein
MRELARNQVGDGDEMAHGAVAASLGLGGLDLGVGDLDAAVGELGIKGVKDAESTAATSGGWPVDMWTRPADRPEPCRPGNRLYKLRSKRREPAGTESSPDPRQSQQRQR